MSEIVVTQEMIEAGRHAVEIEYKSGGNLWTCLEPAYRAMRAAAPAQHEPAMRMPPSREEAYSRGFIEGSVQALEQSGTIQAAMLSPAPVMIGNAEPATLAALAAAQAENAKLRAALRDRAFARYVSLDGRSNVGCMICGFDWQDGCPEAHHESCLAAPKP